MPRVWSFLGQRTGPRGSESVGTRYMVSRDFMLRLPLASDAKIALRTFCTDRDGWSRRISDHEVDHTVDGTWVGSNERTRVKV